MTTDVGKFHFRLVLLGSNRTGKTSILNRFLFKKFETKYKPTVEDLFCKDFDLGSIEIKVDFLDTAGSMQFPAMRRLSITTGSAFLIVYSIDDESSFEVAKMCIAEIQEIRPDYQDIPIVFVGNKCDLPKEQRNVSKEEVSNHVYNEVQRLRAKVIECSCKENYNVDNIFRAYLSLARVSLSSAVYVGRGGNNGGSIRGKTTTDEAQIDECNEQELTTGSGDECKLRRNAGSGSISQRRPSSMKVALGVRKSCDASIITSMRNVSITVTPEEHKHILSDSGQGNTIFTTSDKEQELNNQMVQADSYLVGATRIQTSEVILEKALKSKLNLGGGAGAGRGSGRYSSQNSEPAKPRSRSLIWRATRSKAKASAHSNDQDCRVT